MALVSHGIRNINFYDAKLKKYVTVAVDVMIDITELAERLGIKAYSASGNKSVSVHGAVVVKVS